jgi:hypothetical protein
VGNNERHQHVEELISQDLKIGEKTQAANLKDRQEHIAINSETPP